MKKSLYLEGGIHKRWTAEQGDLYMDWWSKQFCVSFIALWSQNWSFQTPQRCQFFNPYWFWSSPMVMNLGKDWKSAISSTNHRVRLSWRVHSMILYNEVHSCEICKVLNAESLLLQIVRVQVLSWFNNDVHNTSDRIYAVHSKQCSMWLGAQMNWTQKEPVWDITKRVLSNIWKHL